MASVAGYFDRKPTATARPGLSHLQADPSTPQTPQRTFSSAFSSPSFSYRAEEEVLVFEIGARHLSAGIAGESNPRCRLGFSPEDARRVGDYRQYYPEYEDRPRKRKRNYQWGEDHELWRMDLRSLDLGLVEDKVERAVRAAYTKYLLLDSKNRRMVLVLPSLMPHRLLSSLLSSIFVNFQVPSITLFSSPIASVVAAGCRSGLVIDIGWSETIITSVYEYREVHTRRTTRALRLVTQRLADLLKEHAEQESTKAQNQASGDTHGQKGPDEDTADSRYFDFAEEVTSRIAWCPTGKNIDGPTSQEDDPAKTPTQETITDAGPPNSSNALDDSKISIPSPLPPRKTLEIPFPELAQPVESILLAPNNNPHDLDDHEQPLPQLIYTALLYLPPDVRSVCTARMIITGGGSQIPGLKTRLLNELKRIVGSRGWDGVYGKIADERRDRLKEVNNGLHGPDTAVKDVASHSEPQMTDEITEKLEQGKAKRMRTAVAGEIRGVETLGAWAGGSLAANLRVKGVVEIDRDSFISNGLGGAKRESEIASATQRMGLGARASLDAKTGWTLGPWA
ncbi:MAG: hypothetical protein Q9218_007760 [Villophora microphyllina]